MREGEKGRQKESGKVKRAEAIYRPTGYDENGRKCGGGSSTTFHLKGESQRVREVKMYNDHQFEQWRQFFASHTHRPLALLSRVLSMQSH